MIAPPKKPKIEIVTPVCCGRACRLTNGAEIYRGRADLAHKNIWKCDGCGAYVGCHGNSTRPLGTPAGPELRRAREILHNDLVDPLWMTADRCGLYNPEDDRARVKIRKAARRRVYAYLAHHLGIAYEDCHVASFDIYRAREAWNVLKGVTYIEIREWYEADKAEKQKQQAQAEGGANVAAAHA